VKESLEWGSGYPVDWSRAIGLSAIVDVLQEIIERDPSEAALMDKWSEDLILAAQKAQEILKARVSSPYQPLVIGLIKMDRTPQNQPRKVQRPSE
jgi:hypothetical protein